MAIDLETTNEHRRPRHMLGLEPVFEGGWLHLGRRARRWNAERRISALALFGDAVVDLAAAHSVPEVVDISAWAVLRDVTILVPPGTHVDVVGDSFVGEVHNATPMVPAAHRTHSVRVACHGVLGDIDVKVAAV